MSSSTLGQLRWRYIEQMISVDCSTYPSPYDTKGGITPRGKAYLKILKIERAASIKRVTGEWEGYVTRFL